MTVWIPLGLLVLGVVGMVYGVLFGARRLIRDSELDDAIDDALVEILSFDRDPLSRRHAATLMRSLDVGIDEEWLLRILRKERDLNVKLAIAETLLVRTGRKFSQELIEALEREISRASSEGDREAMRGLIGYLQSDVPAA